MQERLTSNENQINIEPFNLENDLANTASLYANIFSGPPWNEYTQCTVDKIFFGKETKPGELCNKCGSELVLAYPLDETKDYIKKEYSRPNSSFLIAKSRTELIGFAWGFIYNQPSDFVTEKYRTEEMQQRVIKTLENNGVSSNFFYFSEAGVIGNFRGRGLSNQLSGKLIDQAKILNCPIVMRTNCLSPMVKIAQNVGMDLVYGPITRVDSIKKEFLRTGTFKNFLDIENSDRVLFAKQTEKINPTELPNQRT